MNLKTSDHVCSRLVYAFHWRNVGSNSHSQRAMSAFGPDIGVGRAETVLFAVPGRRFAPQFALTEGLRVITAIIKRRDRKHRSQRCKDSAL
jgi:hypothetical protein